MTRQSSWRRAVPARDPRHGPAHVSRGTGNVFQDDTAHLDAAGYGFHLTSVVANEVGSDTAVTVAGQGTSNVSCTRRPAPSTLPGPDAEAAGSVGSHRSRHHTS